MKKLLYILAIAAIVVLAFALRSSTSRRYRVAVKPSLEDRMADGSLFNPATQSFLRGKHCLESVGEIEIVVDRKHRATIALEDKTRAARLTLRTLPLDQLVPRLHYRSATPPDAFDAYNLMLAEYSRNSISVPVGKSSDAMAHFETNLPESVPWRLSGDYQFVANSRARPVRFSVINNCLSAGLWELSATDRTGEVYHAWFEMPLDLYADLTAKTNGVDVDFVQSALKWKNDPVTLRLERLREVQAPLGRAALRTLGDRPVGFSSQDSRRKLHKQYIQTLKNDVWETPETLDELTSSKCRFSDFVPPGKYSMTHRKTFDLGFLRAAEHAEISRVKALTHYDWRSSKRQSSDVETACLELMLQCKDHVIIIGNLPLPLLVPQEDFVINGFGAGVLSSGGIAERRNYLIYDGPPPSYAYLCKSTGSGLVGLNSHDYGIEQIFIRTHTDAPEPWWEITITSYERIVDIVKYRVEIPSALHEELRIAAMEYVSPLYRTYRDDNIR